MSCGRKFNEVVFEKDSEEYKAGMLGENENCLPGHECPDCKLNDGDFKVPEEYALYEEIKLEDAILGSDEK